MPDIAHVMTEDPVTVSHTAHIDACEALLLEFGIRHLPVTDDDGAVIGLITDAIARKNVETDTTARSLATRQLLIVPGDSELEDVLSQFVRTGFDVAVVVDDKRKPIGIFTEHDAIGLAASTLSQTPRISGIQPRTVYTIGLDGSAAEALETMMTHRFRHVVVVDGTRAVGVLAYRDLVARGITSDSDAKVADIVGERLLFVTAGTKVLDVCRLMHENKIGCMPVLDDAEAPVRILTRTDVIGALLEDLGEHGF